MTENLLYNKPTDNLKILCLAVYFDAIPSNKHNHDHLELPHFDVICDLLLNRCTETWIDNGYTTVSTQSIGFIISIVAIC